MCICVYQHKFMCAGTGVIGNCELPIVCVGNWTLVLWNSSKCSYCWVISPNSFRFLLLPVFILLSLPSPPPLVIIRMPLPWTLHGEILSLVWGFFLCVGLWQWTSGSKVSTPQILCSNSCVDGKFQSLFCCGGFHFYTWEEMCELLDSAVSTFTERRS